MEDMRHHSKDAIRAISKMALEGDLRATKALEEALREALPNLSTPQAEAILKTLTAQVENFSLGAKNVVPSTVAAGTGVESVIAGLTNENPSVRKWAVGELKSSKDPRAVELLVAALKDEAWVVRAGAAEALQTIEDPRAKEALAKSPIALIVASDPKLSSEIDIIEIAGEGKPISLLRLKSVPTLAFPVMSLTSDVKGTKGAIFLDVDGFDQFLQFSSVCACCIDDITGKYPLDASRPRSSEDPSGQKKYEEWHLEQHNWKLEKEKEFLKLLKKESDRYGIECLAARKAHLWYHKGVGFGWGFQMLDTGDPEYIYQMKLGSMSASARSMFRLSR